MMRSAAAPPHTAQRVALVLGVAALAATGVGLLVRPSRVYPSYLFAYVFWLGLSLGSMVLLMIHRVTGGRWGHTIQAPLEAAVRAMPLLALLFIPLLGGLGTLYPWTTPDVGENAPLVHAKSWYLNVPFFVTRAAVFLVLWVVLGHLLTRWSDLEQTRSSHHEHLAIRLLRLSIAGLILYALSVTLAAVDWIGSIVPEFYSTVFGMLVGVGQLLAAAAFAIVCIGLRAPPQGISPDRILDLGNLLLALVLAWGYLALSQFVTIWVADLPHEIAWYVPRAQTSWRWVAALLAALHFWIPFAVLLARAAKRRRDVVATVAWMLLIAHLLYAFWLVTPSIRSAGIALYWSDFTAVIGIGGAWLAIVLRALAIPRPAASPGTVTPRTIHHEPA
jgi:hypothetical protein